MIAPVTACAPPLFGFRCRLRFSNHDLTPHLQNYRNHLQNLRLAQIVVPIVPQRASGRWLSVLRQRHASPWASMSRLVLATFNFLAEPVKSPEVSTPELAI